MNKEVKSWVGKEFETLSFNSKRLEKRFKVAMSDISDQPSLSIWLAAGSRANAKAIYRMLANEKCSKESILSAHRDALNARSIGMPILLAIQDTMSVNYGTHSKTKGIGYNCEQSLGINVHSCVFFTPDGIPMGMSSQSVITRENCNSKEKTHQEKRLRPIEEKESYRWLESIQTASANAPDEAQLIHIADREGDIYELYAFAERIDERFVIRAIHDRIDTNNVHIIQSLRDTAPVCKTVVTVPANHKTKSKEREAVLSVQYQIFDIKRPHIRNGTEVEPTLQLTMLRLAEDSPPEGNNPIEWLLITNLDVKNADDALKIAGYYKQRWKIERFHFVLKSGCTIEKIQQRSVDGIELVIFMYSIISIHIMQLTFLARTAPEMPCDLIFDEIEWKLL